MEVSTTEVSDEALDAVIRSGIRKGRRRQQNRVRVRVLSGVVATIAAAFLFLVVSGSDGLFYPKEQVSAKGPYPVITAFDFGEDITLNTANKHGFIQQVNQTVTEGDYTVTVNGIFVGPQQMELLYTIENHAEAPADLKRIEVKRRGSDEALPYSIGSSGRDIKSGEVFRSRSNILMSEDQPLPEELTISFGIAPFSTNTAYQSSAENEQILEVDLSVDMGIIQQYTTTISINKMLQIDTQSFYLEEVVLSPGGIVLRANIPSSNTMKVSGLWDVYLETVVNGEKIRLNSDSAFLPGAGGGNMTYFFDSNILENPESVTLKASGFKAVDPSRMKLVVDTDKKEILQSPDGDIRFGSYNGYLLTLEYEERTDRHMGSVSIEPEFVDGKGKKHMMSTDTGGGLSSSSRTSTDTETTLITQYIHLEPEDYPQPLTFTLSSYPGVIEKAFEVPIQ